MLISGHWLLVLLLGLTHGMPAQAVPPDYPCFKHHGRLSSQNGIALRIWLIGTNRSVGVTSGELPKVIQDLEDPYLMMTSEDHSYIFGDFTICPMEPDVPGHMRHVSLNAAEKLVIEGARGLRRPPFKVLSTWPDSEKPSIRVTPLKVIISGGFAAVYREVLPEFERLFEIPVTTASGASQGSGPETIGAQLRSGVTADLVILGREGLNDLIREGRIIAETDVDLAQTPVGVGVRAGAPKPDISTVQAFTQALIAAKTIALPGSTTGIYLTRDLFPRLGVADRIDVKVTARGVDSTALVASGGAQLAIQPVSEILPAAGVDLVGTIPGEIQFLSVFSAAIIKGSTRLEEARRLIAFLSSGRIESAIEKFGMETPGRLVARAQSSRSAPYAAASAFDSPRVAALRGSVERKIVDAEEQFWADVKSSGAPIVEPVPGDTQSSFVTFVWRGSSQTRHVVITDGPSAAVGGIDPANSLMLHLDGTSVWYRSYKVRNDGRFVYKLSENDSMQSFVDPNRKSGSVVDPLNPKVFPTNQSYVELADAVPQPTVIARAAKTGKVEKQRFHSTLLNNDRDAWVYTPEGFAPGNTYPLLVMMDGSAYSSWVPTPVILDNLIDQKRIPPTVAILIGSPNRDLELGCLDRFSDFLATELVPFMRKNYQAAETTVIAGSSRGGLASSCAALRHPDVFGKVLSQSGSYWWKPETETQGEWLTAQYARAPKLPLQFYVEVGEMEIPDQLDTNRRLRDVLNGKGYDVDYREFNGNHTYVNWRGSLANGLEVLLGTSPR